MNMNLSFREENDFWESFGYCVECDLSQEDCNCSAMECAA
jgi:hypothetical protein